MFELGSAYRITHEVDGEVWQATFKIVEIEMPLIKVETAVGEMRIINTHSPAFRSAQPFEGKFGEPFELNIDLTDEN